MEIKGKVKIKINALLKSTLVALREKVDNSDKLMATVYIKGGKDVQISIEELADYLHNNADKIGTRHLQRRGLRRRMEGSNDSNLLA